MTALVVGSSGFLGGAVFDLLRNEGVRVFGTHRRQPTPDALPFDFWYGDVAPLLEKTGADTVVFAAAVETDPPTAELAGRAEAFFGACADRRVVYLSSDALFNGLKGNYTEADLPSPVTLYGENLEVVERVVRERCPNACTLRPSYLYGFSRGNLDPRLSSARRKLRSGETVRYAENMFKSPMEVGLAARAVVTFARSSFVGTAHLNGKRTSVFRFYHDAMSVLGLPTETLRFDRLPADAEIPKDTSLDAALMTRLTGVPVLGVREALAR